MGSSAIPLPDFLQTKPRSDDLYRNAIDSICRVSQKTVRWVEMMKFSHADLGDCTKILSDIVQKHPQWKAHIYIYSGWIDTAIIMVGEVPRGEGLLWVRLTDEPIGALVERARCMGSLRALMAENNRSTYEGGRTCLSKPQNGW